MKMYTLAPVTLAISCSISLLSGCGSSDGSDSESADISISGTIVAAPVNNAQVSVMDENGNTIAGPVSTNSTGQYTLRLNDDTLNQNLIIQSSGGTFTDEASGNQGVAAGNMLAYIPANSLRNGSTVSATPGSTIIAELVMLHSKTMTQAQNAFKNAFGYTPNINLNPADATNPAATASEEEKLAGFRAAAFSELTLDLGLMSDQQFDLLAALTKDLSDDVLDAADTTGVVNIGTSAETLQADIQNRFTMALANFHNSAYNQTDLATNQIGNLPFSKTALTNSYKIEYIPGMMAAMEGKSTFKIHITDRVSGSDISGLNPTLMAMMHMPGMTHSTPAPTPSIIEDSNGLYTVTLYYLMASQMMDGTSMGYWDLKLTAATGEEAHFYPPVMMSMGDTVKTRAKGQADLIKDMMGMDVARDYFIFKDSISGSTGSYTLTLFIAAKESMMSFPAVINGNTLQSGMGGTPLPINSISVNVTANDTTSVSATDNGDGTWSVNLNLNDNIANQVEVELSINGERKTSDGTADGINPVFTLTPESM